MKTNFEKVCEILTELWLNHKKDPVFIDFIAYNDLGLPLAYAIAEGVVEKTELAEKYIQETYDLLITALAVEDNGFISLQEILARAEAAALSKLEAQGADSANLVGPRPVQALMDEVWVKFNLSSNWWNNQPDAAYANEMEAVHWLVEQLRAGAWNAQELVDAVESDAIFDQDGQKQTLANALLAWNSEERDVLDKYKSDLIEGGLDFYATYWIASNSSSSAVHIKAAAEYALDSEDSELLEVLVDNPNLDSDLRVKCEEMLEELA